MENILKEAHEAANKAQAVFIDKYGDTMYCGFAWVRVKPAKGPFITYCKKEGLKQKNDRYFGSLSIDGGGGWMFSSPGTYRGQSMDIKEAGAWAFAEVLRSYGINAYASSRAD